MTTSQGEGRSLEDERVTIQETELGRIKAKETRRNTKTDRHKDTPKKRDSQYGSVGRKEGGRWEGGRAVRGSAVLCVRVPEGRKTHTATQVNGTSAPGQQQEEGSFPRVLTWVGLYQEAGVGLS